MKETIEEFINQRVWTVLGVSNNTNKFGYKVFKALLDSGYKVYPVNPNCEEIDGHKCYPDLTSLPEKPEVVNLVIPPSVSERIVGECAKLKIARVWFQPGAESQEATELAERSGIKVIYNECAIVERKFWG
ncbi:MAG: CoA-binding protein [Candidatus Caenarcaniphilales bacterium]|nr:CoA-binding protein [Candidatus Caenarcaniphilales bacterium]